MEKETILLVALGCLVVAMLGLLAGSIIDNGVTQTQKSTAYSYTKAICTEDNFCQDHVIVCDGENLVESVPITGASVQFGPNWNDPRPVAQINGVCNLQ